MTGMAPSGSDDGLQTRLEAAMLDIASAKDICRAPSISVGVLHNGRVVFQRSIGLRDVEANLEANSDTSYLIGSCSKLFTSTATGMLVGDKLSWDDCVSKHLPDFDPAGDPEVREKATITDLCRHSTGLANPNAVFCGPGGVLNTKGEDHIAFVNALPTANDAGQRFRSWWYYSNAAFGLLANVVEAVSKTSLSSFLRDRLCSPLGLSQTLLTESDVQGNTNVAHPYVQLENGCWSRIENSYTTGSYGAVLASMGMRTSVNDMLALLAAVMSRHDEENDVRPCMDLLPQSKQNPLKNITSMWNCWWSRPCDDGFDNQTAYTLGWFRTTMPTRALGMTSYNSVHKHKDQDIIGRESVRRTVYGHSGCINGSVATAYLVPASHSAVVAFSNAADAGDAAETASQMLLQALFDLQPRVDLTSSLKVSAAARRQMHDDMIKEWQDHRSVDLYTATREELQGTYLGLGVSRIYIVPSETAPSGLAVTFGDAGVRCDLEPYNADSLSFHPMKHVEKLQKAMIDWDYWTVGVFHFVRKDEEESSEADGVSRPVIGLRWQWDEYDKPGFWEKLRGDVSGAEESPES